MCTLPTFLIDEFVRRILGLLTLLQPPLILSNHIVHYLVEELLFGARHQTVETILYSVRRRRNEVLSWSNLLRAVRIMFCDRLRRVLDSIYFWIHTEEEVQGDLDCVGSVHSVSQYHKTTGRDFADWLLLVLPKSAIYRSPFSPRKRHKHLQNSMFKWKWL